MHVVVRIVRILALLQMKTLIETKKKTLKCLKWPYSTVQSMKNVAVLMEDGAFAVFFCPHPGGFDSSRVPTLGNCHPRQKKCQCPGVSPGGGGGGLGAGGIDWCIRSKPNWASNTFAILSCSIFFFYLLLFFVLFFLFIRAPFKPASLNWAPLTKYCSI